MTGKIQKTAVVDVLTANTSELEKINKYTLEEARRGLYIQNSRVFKRAGHGPRQ